MAMDPTAWFVEQPGVLHSSALARNLAYASTNGSEGIVQVADLKVSATPTPSGSVRVAPGVAILVSRYAGASGQSYVARNATSTNVVIQPTGSSGGRNDLVVLRISDTGFAGTPGDNVNDYDYSRLEVIQGVNANTKTAKELGLNYPAIALALIKIPASTATITNAMVSDLREVAMPRRQSELRTYALTGEEGKILGNTTAYPTGSTWSDEAPDAWGPIDIPEWATRAKIVMTWAGVGCPAGNANGWVWTQIGLNTNDNKVITQGTKYDTASSGGWTRQVFISADNRPIPQALRGTSQKFYPRANVNASVPTASRVQLDSASSIILQVEFLEVAD